MGYGVPIAVWCALTPLGLGAEADGVEAVLAEGLQHHLFLGRVLGKVKS